MLLHKPQQAGKWARFLPKDTSPFLCIFCTIRQTERPGELCRITAFSCPFLSCALRTKKGGIVKPSIGAQTLIPLRIAPSKSAQPLCAVIFKVYSYRAASLPLHAILKPQYPDTPNFKKPGHFPLARPFLCNSIFRTK